MSRKPAQKPCNRCGVIVFGKNKRCTECKLICGKCNIRPAIPSHRWCTECNTANVAARNKRLKEIGVCIRCGKKSRKGKLECQTCADNAAPRIKADKVALFLEVLDAYGGRQCACCGEKEVKFLSLDHVNNDGAAHRRNMGHCRRQAGEHQWYWLRNHNWPQEPKLQVLCMNCQIGKVRNGGICPHLTSQGETK